MSLWDDIASWLGQQGDPEATAAAQNSTAMQPLIQDYLSRTFSQRGQAQNLQNIFGPPPTQQFDPGRPLGDQIPALTENSPALNIALGFSGGGLGTTKIPGLLGDARGGPAGPSFATPSGLDERLGRLLNRGPDIGAPKNSATELEPGIFIGNGTHDQWLARTEKVLDQPGEIQEARDWYKNASGAYNQSFGPDLGPQMMGGWLTGNVNASPSFAQLSALRAREQLINRTGLISEQKKGGLADDALRSYWQAQGTAPAGETPMFGIGHNQGPPLDDATGVTAGGQKIYDFIDSANGSPTRTFYGHDPRAGAPFVADVHSLRDMGMVDGPVLSWAEKTYGPDAVAGLKKDAIGGGPSETQYEWSANKGRDLTDWLNKQGYMGGGWTPAEVQAVGWKTMSKMMGRAGETPEQAITANTRPMSYELDPGQGSPFERWFQSLGWHNLDSEQQAQVTHNVMGPILDFAKQQTGAIESNRLQGLGGWNNAGQATLAPANRSYIVSSPEVFGDMADMVGYLGNQTKVLGMRPMNSGSKLGVGIYHPELADPSNVQALWDGLVQNHPDFAQGFSPSVHPDGTPGMEMLFDKGGVGMSNRIQSELLPGIDKIADDAGLGGPDLRIGGFKAEDLSREHDWTQDPTAATGYLGRLVGRYGPSILQRLEDFKTQTLHPLIEREISSRQPKAGAAQVAPQGIVPPGLLNPQ